MHLEGLGIGAGAVLSWVQYRTEYSVWNVKVCTTDGSLGGARRKGLPESR